MKYNESKFEEFNRIFLKEIYPEYENIEKERKKLQEECASYTKSTILNLIIPIIMVLGLVIITLISFIDSLINGFMLVPFCIVFTAIFINLLWRCFVAPTRIYDKKYKKYLKKRYLKKILRVFLNLQIVENPTHKNSIGENGLFSCNEMAASGLRVADFDPDDEFEGEYKGVKYRISESHKSSLIIENGEKIPLKNSQAVFGFDFNKKIEYPLLLISKKNLLKSKSFIILSLILIIILPWLLLYSLILILCPILLITIIIIAKMFHKAYKCKITGKVILEDSKFNRRFNVLCNDQIEARYICTTAMMDRLYNLKTTFGAKNFKASFFNYNNMARLIIVIDTDIDIFEMGEIDKEFHKSNNIYQLYREINSIYQIIDQLKLYEKTKL